MRQGKYAPSQGRRAPKLKRAKCVAEKKDKKEAGLAASKNLSIE